MNERARFSSVIPNKIHKWEQIWLLVHHTVDHSDVEVILVPLGGFYLLILSNSSGPQIDRSGFRPIHS